MNLDLTAVFVQPFGDFLGPVSTQIIDDEEYFLFTGTNQPLEEFQKQSSCHSSAVEHEPNLPFVCDRRDHAAADCHFAKAWRTGVFPLGA